MYHPNPPSPENGFLKAHAHLLNASFHKLLGYPLLESSDDELAEKLFHAPFALLSHNTDAEPLFNYANQVGLDLFELDWLRLIELPSKASAEAMNQAARDKLLAQVTTQGFVTGYQGVRISSSGRRFEIEDAVIWNLYDDGGDYRGQAAYFSKWRFL